jgi:hypothetical protein
VNGVKVGIALLRCGEPQCARLLASPELSRFHCVHIAENVAPYHVAINQTVQKCFDSGSDWVVMLDGDMDLDTCAFWSAFNEGLTHTHKAMYFRLYDPYVSKVIGSLKVVTKSWMVAAGWYQDSICTDRDAEQRAKDAGCPRWASDAVVGTHFDDPTQFQVFKRFFVRGIKVKAGYSDPVGDYERILKGVALESYKRGLNCSINNDPHDLPILLYEYNEMLGDNGLVCGVCAWGEYPYHTRDTLKATDVRRELPVDSGMKANYINKLAVSVGRNMKVKHKMFYISPEPIAGVIPECQWQKLETPCPKGNLHKLSMYNPKYTQHGRTFITFDLDNIIIGDVSAMPVAISKSRGFICRSDLPTLGKNIAGGDMIGYTKQFASWMWAWVNENRDTAEFRNVIEDGMERFLYRYMIHNHSEFGQFWHEFLGKDYVLGWKSHLRDGRSAGGDTHIISVWGDWAVHELVSICYADNLPNWLQYWVDSYGRTSNGKAKTVNKDVEMWKLCRASENPHQLFLDLESAGMPVWKDPDGQVLYRRMRGDVIRVKPDSSMPHPNCLPPVKGVL